MEDKKVIVAGAKLFAAAAGVLLAGFWIVWVATAYLKNRSVLKEFEPAIKEAKSLGLDYDTVLAGGNKYEDKNVLWCVQNRGEEAVSYKGDPGRRLAVSNFPAMPLVSGSKHESCSDMLLKVKSGNAANGVVTVRFMHNFK
ncbi:MAG: hypothetical protein A3J79_01925 [Elusimicrobia bacterium RIFOXYB2_FULL_62_6]|nr:MAG: hypothetical protein A3J79_01925 [Elusimicrobia bacterium RIFOXYB2_FULL_62_6]